MSRGTQRCPKVQRCKEVCRCCMLHVARCTLHVARCTLHVARCTLHVACYTLHAARCTLHAARKHARCKMQDARCNFFPEQITEHIPVCCILFDLPNNELQVRHQTCQLSKAIQENLLCEHNISLATLHFSSLATLHFRTFPTITHSTPANYSQIFYHPFQDHSGFANFTVMLFIDI